MRILILNQHTSNRGDEAAARGLFGALAAHGGITGWGIMYNNGRMGKEDRFDFSPAGVPAPDHFDGFRPTFREKVMILLTFIWPFSFSRRLCGILAPRLAGQMKIMASYDRIINAPGGVNIGPYRDWLYLWRLYVAIKLDRPTAIYSISFGPLPENRIFRRSALYCLQQAAFLSLRDRKSQDYAEALQIKYVPSIDTAFLQKRDGGAAGSLPEDIRKGTYIVVVPNRLYRWHPLFAGMEPGRLDALYLSLIQRAQNMADRVMLLPQLFGSQDDYEYLESLRRQTMEPEQIVCLSPEYDSEVQQRIIAGARFLIGARYHAVVFALRNGIPFAALSYEHKMTDMLSLLNLSHHNFDLKTIIDSRQEKATLEAITGDMAMATKLTEPIKEAATRAERIARETFEIFAEKFLSGK